MNKKTKIIFIVILILFAVISFCVGYFLNELKNKKSDFGFNQKGFQARSGINLRIGQNGQGMKGGMIMGEVIAKDEKGITIKLSDGGSKIIIYSDKTEFLKLEKGIIDDVVIGGIVSIFGEDGSGGTYIARSIQSRNNFAPNISPNSAK